MRLCKLQLRYYPPGIILQYEKAGFQLTKPLELLNLTSEADIEARSRCCHALQRRVPASCAPAPLELPTIAARSAPQVVLSHVLTSEPLLGDRQRPVLRQLLSRLVAKLSEPAHSQFDLFKARGAAYARRNATACTVVTSNGASRFGSQLCAASPALCCQQCAACPAGTCRCCARTSCR